jgi:Zn-dependent protease/CBS domain-containing protein
MPLSGALTLLRVKGVPVRAHWTLLLIVPYIAVVFSGDFARVAEMAGVSARNLTLPPLFFGVLLAIGLFVSVAVHELAHTLVALRVGGKVREITLMLIGGVSQIERLPDRKGVEALMAAAGPATSLVLGALLHVSTALLPASAVDLRLGLFYLGHINLVLGLFNLLPAFPMDGGRVLRSLLATRLGALRATDIAALIGKAFAVLMAAAGLWAGNFLLLIIAFFLYAGAGAEARVEQIRHAIEGVRVAELMRPDPPAVRFDTRLAALPRLMRSAGRMELVVTDERGHPLGLVRASDLTRFAPADRERLTVRDIGDTLVSSAIQAPLDDPARTALERADETGADYVIAIDQSTADPPSLAGLLARNDIEKLMLLRSLDEPADQDERRHRASQASAQSGPGPSAPQPSTTLPDAIVRRG